RTCITSALITLARLGQCVSTSPTTSPLNPPPNVNEIRISVTRCGTLRKRSISQEMMRSAIFPVDAIIPSTSSIITLPIAPASPNQTDGSTKVIHYVRSDLLQYSPYQAANLSV